MVNFVSDSIYILSSCNVDNVMSDLKYDSCFMIFVYLAPDPKWPRRAKVALQFVINYEEGAENCLLHGDTASESLLSEIIGVPPYVGERHTNMESLYDYGSR